MPPEELRPPNGLQSHDSKMVGGLGFRDVWGVKDKWGLGFGYNLHLQFMFLLGFLLLGS